MEDFEATLQRYRKATEKALSDFLPPESAAPPIIHQSIHYALRAGGKRLRPVLLLATADLYPHPHNPLPAAVALECLHTYSLVHDDLPCMDDSPLRRGQPSVHVRFNEAQAVLTGDALLTEAFRILARHYKSSPPLAADLLDILATAADSQHLIGGQVLDTFLENKTVSPDILTQIHQHKTADLLTAALLMGARLAEAPTTVTPLLRSAGAALGSAFQITDDILDATASTETLGKQSGSDARSHKNTYVSLHGLPAARQAAAQATRDALHALRQLPNADTAFLAHLTASIEHRIH